MQLRQQDTSTRHTHAGFEGLPFGLSFVLDDGVTRLRYIEGVLHLVYNLAEP